MKRSEFLKSSLLLGGAAAMPNSLFGNNSRTYSEVERKKLFEAMKRPVLKKELLSYPVIADKIELRKTGDIYFVRIISKDGVEGTAVANRRLMYYLYPIFNHRVKPVFEEKDLRNLEELFDELIIFRSNYKIQSLPFWVCASSLEFAVLDLLGKTFNLSVGELLGKVIRTHVPIYRASGNRKNSPEEEIEYLQKLISQDGAKAVKFRLGARMRYTDFSTKRDKKLIPLARKTFGDDFILYADANGSFDVEMGIRIGRLMEEYNYGYFEEPVPFDYYEETKEVNEGLKIPVAGGEQERSLRQFLWMIENRAVDILNPDPLLFGGLIRAIKVARMGKEAGLQNAPHMSGFGLGYLYVLHYASIVPNFTNYLEYKGEKDKVPFECSTSTLKPEDGVLQVPTGPGWGIELDPEFIKSGELIG